MNLAEQIEQYLLERGTWVTCAELSMKFGVRPRRFRKVGDQPGLCSAFAISDYSGNGFKHVAHATTKEWLEFKHAHRRHGISELVRVRDLSRKRKEVTRPYRARRFERDTGQAVFGYESQDKAAVCTV